MSSASGVGVKLYRTTVQTIPNAQAPTVVFDGAQDDPWGMWSATVNPENITIVHPGLYAIGCDVLWHPNAVGRREVRILVNGANEVYDSQPGSSEGNGPTLNATTIKFLEAGDTIQLKVFQNSGGDLDIATAGVILPVLWAARIG